MGKTLATRMAFGHEIIEIAKTQPQFRGVQRGHQDLRAGEIRQVLP